MERVCFLRKVKPDRLAEYKEWHKRVWPEMLDAIREAGWHNYSLFLREDGLLVGYFETPDYQGAWRAWPSGKSICAGSGRWHRSSRTWKVAGPTSLSCGWRRSFTCPNEVFLGSQTITKLVVQLSTKL